MKEIVKISNNSEILKEKSKSLKICERAKLDIGTFCNLKCNFCYYFTKTNIKFDLDLINNRFESLYNLGCRDFDLSGGEPSLLPNIENLISKIKDLSCNVSMVSNGTNLSKEKLKNLYNLGLKEILFSLHFNKENHNKIVGVYPNGVYPNGFNVFDKVFETILIAKEIGFKIRINSVLFPNQNLNLDEFLKNLNILNPSQFNILPINNFSECRIKRINEFIDTEEFSDFLKELDEKSFEVNIRYVPFCQINSQRINKTFKNIKIKNFFNQLFDLTDWSPAYYEYKQNTIENCLDEIFKIREKYYTKKLECLRCPMFYECDGFKKEM